MQETARTRGEREPFRPGGHGPNGDALPGMVTVSSGPYSESLPVADSTVGEIRARLRDRFDLPPNSQAMLDGNEVGDDVIVRASQALTFVRQSGEKGRGRDHGCKAHPTQR